MTSRNLVQIVFIGVLICLTSGACSPFRRHAEPDVKPVQPNDVAPIEEETLIQTEPPVLEDITPDLPTSTW